MKKYLMFLIIFTFLPLFAFAEEKGGPAVHLYALNIGKADCMILSYQNQHYLIDTGYEHTYPALETALKALEINSLQGVFLTHCHKDHEGGLMPLVKSNIEIDAIYAAEIFHDVKDKKHPAMLAAKERNMEVSFLKSGDVLPIGSDASLTVLGPVRKDTENENNNSLVMRFSSPHGSVLFAGDMKAEEEYDLLTEKLLSQTDVLKCGHHGDSEASSAAFLQAVRPTHALILTSTFEENDTPAPSTLKRLKSINSKVYVSQDAKDALHVEMQDGRITVSDMTWPGIPEAVTGLRCHISTADDAFMLANLSDKDIALSGCTLYSSKGEDSFPLPDIRIPAGQTISIGSKSTNGSAAYTIDKKNIWHDKKRDMAMLYDAWGRLLCQADNGLLEE